MKTVLKWLGIAVTAVICIALLGAAVVYATSNKQINKRYRDIGAAWVAVPKDSATIARGRHIVQAIGKCVDCHRQDLGGGMFIDAAPFAKLPAPNITAGQGGRLATYTDEELARLLQHGVKRDGRSAIIMPSDVYTLMSDADLTAVIAYLRTVPPVNRTWPEPTFGPIFRMLVFFGKLPVFQAEKIDHNHAAVVAPPAGPTAEYGKYLASIGGCGFCHNRDFSGGPIVGGDPASPPSANLTPAGIGDWTEADFMRVFREGKGIAGRVINENYMPWRSAGLQTDDELHAIWLFLKTLPSKEFGQH